MQFIKLEDNFRPVFSVWSIENSTGKLLPNRKKSGHFLKTITLGWWYLFLLPNFLGNTDFEFKFYR